MRTIDLTQSFALTSSINTYAPPVPVPSQVPGAQGSVFWPSITQPKNLELMLGTQQARKLDIDAGKLPAKWPTSAQLLFDTTTNTWASQRTSTKIVPSSQGGGFTEDVENRMYSARAQVWVERRKMGFYLEGLVTEDNVMTYGAKGSSAYGLMIYDGEKREWRNETGLANRMQENTSMVHLEAGEDDLLIVLGGESQDFDRVSEFRLVCT